jgi:DNA-binding transcriptional LysR family regulator
MNTRIELRHLRYFVAVAEELHFGRAARRLHIAQPPLSHQIRQLESMLNYPLLERTSRAVRLTAAGVVFLERAQRTLRNVAEDVDEVRRIGRGELGFLRVGFIGSGMLTRIPALLGAYRRAFPLVRLQLHEAFTATLITALQRSELDAAFLRDADPEEGLEVRTLFVEPFVAVLPRNHPEAGASALALDLLRDDPFVLFPSVAGKRAWDKTTALCEANGFMPRVVQEAPQWLTILRLVGAGLGVTIAPACVAQIAGDGVVCLPIVGAAITSDIEFATRAGDERAIVREFAASALAAPIPSAALPAGAD